MLGIVVLGSGQLLAGALWNGTFESGSLAPWVVSQGSAVAGTNAHSGNYGLTMGPTAAAVIATQQVAGLAPGQTYIASAWVKSSGTSGAGVELAIGGMGDLVVSSASPTTSWQLIQKTFLVGSSGTITVYIGQLPSSGAVTTFWDDISIAAVAPANGGFESSSLAPWTVLEGPAELASSSHSGHNGLALGPSSTETTVLQQITGLNAGQSYLVSAWVKSSSTSNGGAQLAVGGASGVAGSKITPTSSWQQVNQSYVVGPDETITIYLEQFSSPSLVTTYWDDVTVTASAGTPAAAPNVLSYHNDAGRTGQNTDELILTPSNVAPSTFGKLFTRQVDGFVLAQPLYMTGQFVQGSGFHNVLVGATEEESVYLFDADSNQGANANPLWHIKLIDSAHGGQPGEISAPSGPCSFGPVNEGVTSTPVIDPNTGVLYVEAKSSLSGNVVHRLHAIDMSSGAEEPGWPVTIAGSVAGTGDGSANGRLTFNPNVELGRAGLLLSGGGVYAGFASNGCDADYGDVYHGWLFRVDAATGKIGVVSITPNAHADASGAPAAGGIWMSGAAPAADAAGNVYLATANGTFDTTLNANGMPAQGDYSDSILEFAPGASLAISDYFTPISQGSLDDDDADLGSGGVMLLPDQAGPFPRLLLEAGKDRTIRLINRDRMMHYCGTCSADPVVQAIPNALPNVELGMAAYWNGNLYFGNNKDYIRSFPINRGVLGTSAAAISTDPVPSGYGTTPSISSNGLTNGIVWGIQQWAGPPDGFGVLKAWDATSLSNIYSSNNQFGTDDPGGYAEFTLPTVAHGKVYVGTSSNITVYGLLPSARSSVVTNAGFESGGLGQSWNIFVPSGGTGTVTVSGQAALSGNFGLEEGPNSNGEVAYQVVNGLTPGLSYLVSAWMILGSGAPGTVFLYADDTTGANSCSTTPIAPATIWVQLSCLYTVTSNGAMGIHMVENAGAFTSYWDNVSVTLVPPVNGGFESGVLKPSWSTFVPSGGTGSISVSAGAARSGSFGLIEGSNSNGETAYQTVNALTPGQSYLASAWVKLGSGTAGTAYLYVDDTTGANACASAIVAPLAEWQQISCVYTATNNQAANIHLVEHSGAFSTYWDDVALTPLPPANGGFESGSFSAPWNSYLPQGVAGSLEVSTLAARSGSYGLVEGPTSVMEAAYQNVYGLTPGQSYFLSAWVRLGTGNAGTVFLYASDTLTGNYCATPATTPTAGWQQISCLYTAISSGPVAIYLAQNPGMFSTYWDDVAVTPAPPVNESFENGTIKPWTASIPNGGTGSITVSRAAAHSGVYGLVEGPNSSNEVASQVVQGLTAGQTYIISAWLKLGSAGTGASYLSVDDTVGAHSCNTPANTPPQAWQQINCTFTATNTQMVNIRLIETAGTLTTYWDDVMLSGPLTASAWGNFAPSSVWINLLGLNW